MGIDVYMSWRGISDAEQRQQVTGFSTTAGEAGYLREAYHGGPYATRYLLQESFDEGAYEQLTPEQQETWKGPAIPASVLRERLPTAVFIALARNAIVYGGDPADRIGGSIELPDNPEEDPMQAALAGFFSNIARMREGTLEFSIATALNPEQKRALEAVIASRNLPDYALAFVDFVNLAERKERETGEPVRIYASY